MWLVVLCALYATGQAQIVRGPWCLPEPVGPPPCVRNGNTLAEFYYGTITRNGTEFFWMDFEVFQERWMGVGLASSTVGTVGQMIGVHAYIDGKFGPDPPTLEEWQLGNHSLYIRHPQQNINNLIRFTFAPGQRSIRFDRPLISPDRWDSPINLSGDLKFIWAIGETMDVSAHTPALKGIVSETFATPSTSPTNRPTYGPTRTTSASPSTTPSKQPSQAPFKPGSPSVAPTPPTFKPTVTPTANPSTTRPTFEPTVRPSLAPSQKPGSPSAHPTPRPTFFPTPSPSTSPPTNNPTPLGATARPSGSPATSLPSSNPTQAPSLAVVVNGPETTQSAAGTSTRGSGEIPPWMIPLIVAAAVLFCCMLCAIGYLRWKRTKDLVVQRETREEARKHARNRLAAAKRREEQALDDEIKPIDLGLSDDKGTATTQNEPLLAGGYHGPPSSRRQGGGGLATARSLNARPVKRSKFSSAFGDDDDF